MHTVFKDLIKHIHQYLNYSSHKKDAYIKRDRSPITIADIGIQVLINQMILQHYPDDHVISEEHSPELSHTILQTTLSNLQQSGQDITEKEINALLDYRGNPKSKTTWYIDPIDGTKGYLRNNQFAIAIARFHQANPDRACLICPMLPYPTLDSSKIGSVLYWQKNSEITQSHLDQLETQTSINLQQETKQRMLKSVEKTHGNFSINDKLMEKLPLQESLAIDSQAKYALLARAEASIYLRMPRDTIYREKTWDHGAGLALLEAAGGTVTDIRGKKLDFSYGNTLKNNLGILATRGINHHAAIETLNTLIPKELRNNE